MRAARWAILACFLLSGASSLVFETLWTRDLTLVFGATTPAISTVLGVFMAGLALGSALGGRLAKRVRDLPRAYAFAEAAIGLYALLVPRMLHALPTLHAKAHVLFHSQPTMLSLTRLVATALVLLPPTTLMGATLPVLSRYFVEHAGKGARVGRAVGALYAWNTTGAVLGTFVGGFVLLPQVGKLATNLAAALTNVTLAVLVLLTARWARPPAEGSLESFVPDDESEPIAPITVTPRVRRLVLGAFAISGATAMVCQVLWNRALAIVIGSSVYSFTLILLAFLIGLAIGAAILGPLTTRSRRPLLWLGVVHLSVGACVLVSYVVMDKLPGAFLTLLRGGTFSVEGVIACQFLLALLALLPPTLAMGGVFPITVHLVSRGTDQVGRDVGQAYALNTVGSIVGSVAAGFVILPVVGLELGLRGCAVVSIALGAVFVLLEGRKVWRVAIVAALTALALFLPRWDLLRFSAGLFRVSIARQIIELGHWALPHLEYYKDGTATTVSVEKWSRTVALKNNGKVDASNGDDMATQIMVGLMPFVFHPTALDKPPRAAVIGFGSGVTIGAVTQFPIASADVVELEPRVVEAGTRFFGNVNHDPANDPRVHVVIDDGRSFLAAGGASSGDKYDVIVSEPSNPWISGVSNLFTTDYWKIARSRLADDGVFCQWAQLYELSPRNVKILLRSFSSVFPYTYVFAAEDLSSDVIMVASNHPLELDLPHLRRAFAHPTLGPELKRGGVETAEDLVAQLLLVPEELPAFTAGAPLNTDDNALIEYAAPRDLLGTFHYDPYLARVYGTDWPYGRFESHLASFGDSRSDTEAKLARALLAHGRRAQASRFWKRARESGAPGDGPTQQLLDALDLKNTREFEIPLGTPTDGDPLGLDALEPARTGPSAKPGDAERVAKDGKELIRRARAGAYAHALLVLRDWPDYLLAESGHDTSLVVGVLLYKAELYAEAIDRLKPLLDDNAYVEKRPALLYYLARAEYGEAIYDAAVRNMERYLRRGQ